MEKPDFKKLFDSFDGLNVLIIGDVMVDSYIWGQVSRISPEAPVPIVAVKNRENRLGGAANVALNIKALGAHPVLCSVVGNDQKGHEFIGLLNAENMETGGIDFSTDRATTAKYRVIGNRVQMLRVDEESNHDLIEKDKSKLFEKFRKLIDSHQFDVIIFQDYDKGIITKDLIDLVVGEAKKRNIPVTVDPKKRNFSHYKGVTMFKPNLNELREGLNRSIDPTEKNELRKATSELRKMLESKIILITLSEFGIYIDAENSTKDNHFIIPSLVRSISDVSGAGDTVISVASLCLAKQVDPGYLALISNFAGGLVCEKVGVVPVNKQQLLDALLKLKDGQAFF